jgi:hypothetical protein
MRQSHSKEPNQGFTQAYIKYDAILFGTTPIKQKLYLVMIQFTLGKKKVNVASSWDDFNFNQYITVLKGPIDTRKAISICSGIDEDTIRSAKTIVGLESLLEAVKFLNTAPKYPTSVTQIGKYKLPLDSRGEFNPQFQRLDQFEDMRKAMVASDKGIIQVTEAYATYCAIYLQAMRDKEYNFDSAMAMVEEVKQMPAREVIPAGSFFLIKLLNLSTGIKKTSPNTSLSPKKSKRALTTSKKRSGSMRPSRKSRKR